MRTISATEAKVNFGAVSRQVIETDEPVIVASHGQPSVAIVPVEQLGRLQEFEEREKRQAKQNKVGLIVLGDRDLLEWPDAPPHLAVIAPAHLEQYLTAMEVDHL